MKTKFEFRKLLLVLSGILTLACMLVSKAVPMPAPTETPTASVTLTPTITQTPTITITPTPHYSVELTAPKDFPAGGFKAALVKGYTPYIGPARLTLVSSDKKITLYLYTFPNRSGLTAKGLISSAVKNVEKDYEDFTSSDPVVENQGGVDEAAIEFTGTRDDEFVKGRFAIYAPENSKLLFLYIFAIGDQRWEREGQQVYDQISSSLSFTSIQVLQDGCPASTNHGYGYSAQAPIKIGGGLRTGEERISDYLDVLLGSKGELVNYYRVGVKTIGDASLERYNIVYGNSAAYKTLYFDIYNYSDLKIPFGLACSAPLPPKP